MAYEESGGQFINIENIQNCQVGAYNTILQDSNNDCLLHEYSCTTCESVVLHRAVSQENRNNHLELISNLNKISLKVEAQHKLLSEVIWEQRRLKTKQNSIVKVFDELAQSKIKNKNKGGKLKNGIKSLKQYFIRKSKAKTYDLEDTYNPEDDEPYDTISLHQQLHQEAPQEQQSFRGESSQDQQPLRDEAIQDQQSLSEAESQNQPSLNVEAFQDQQSMSDEAIQDQQSLSDEEIQDQQSLTEEGYSDLYSSGRNYHSYQRLNNHTNTDGNYNNLNEATVSASESTSYSVPTIASTVQNTNPPYKMYQSQFGSYHWDVLY